MINGEVMCRVSLGQQRGVAYDAPTNIQFNYGLIHLYYINLKFLEILKSILTLLKLSRLKN